MYRVLIEFVRAEQAHDAYAFRFGPQTYLVRSHGGAFDSVEFDWNESVEILYEARVENAGPQVHHRIGDILRKFLSTSGWNEHEAAVVRALQNGQGVSIAIRSAAAELYLLPWELLTLRSSGQFLGSLPSLSLHYEWPATDSIPSQYDDSSRSSRVICAWSDAGGAVPHREHLAALSYALGAVGAVFDQNRDVIAHATATRLTDALDNAVAMGLPVDAVHLLCHGGHARGVHGIVLDSDDSGEPAFVDPGRVQQIFAPYAGMVRMIVLAVCDTGGGSAPGGPLGSVGLMLHRAGFQCVIASRFPLSVKGSVILTQTLYSSLTRGRATLEDAIASTRAKLARTAPSCLDWASIQLYSRFADGGETRPLAFTPAGQATPITAAVGSEISQRTRRRGWLPVVAAMLSSVIALVLIIARPWEEAAEQFEGAVKVERTELSGKNGKFPPPVAFSEDSESRTVSTTETSASPTLREEYRPPSRGSAVAASSVSKKKRKKLAPKASGECAGPVKALLRNQLPDRRRDNAAAGLAIDVESDGSTKVSVLFGDSEVHSKAENALRRVKSARLRAKAGNTLPCSFEFTWYP